MYVDVLFSKANVCEVNIKMAFSLDIHHKLISRLFSKLPTISADNTAFLLVVPRAQFLIVSGLGERICKNIKMQKSSTQPKRHNKIE